MTLSVLGPAGDTTLSAAEPHHGADPRPVAPMSLGVRSRSARVARRLGAARQRAVTVAPGGIGGHDRKGKIITAFPKTVSLYSEDDDNW